MYHTNFVHPEMHLVFQDTSFAFIGQSGSGKTYLTEALGLSVPADDLEPAAVDPKKLEAVVELSRLR